MTVRAHWERMLFMLLVSSLTSSGHAAAARNRLTHTHSRVKWEVIQ